MALVLIFFIPIVQKGKQRLLKIIRLTQELTTSEWRSRKPCPPGIATAWELHSLLPCQTCHTVSTTVSQVEEQ